MIVTRSSAAPRSALWATVSDLDHWADWLPTVTSSDPVRSGTVPGLGAAYVLIQPGLAKATWTVTDWRPGEGFTWVSKKPGVTTTGRHELRARPDGSTEIELGVDWSGPLAPLVRALFGRRTKSYVEREAAALDATARDRTA